MILEQNTLLGFIQIFCTAALVVVTLSVIIRLHMNNLKSSIAANTRMLNEINHKINILGRLHESTLDIESVEFEDAEMLADDADDIDDIDDIDETDDISPDAKLYVGNIDYSVTESELKDLFTKFGEVDMVNIPVHRHSGRTRGFGFVTFLRVDHASKALKLNGTEFRGRSLQINYAKSKAS